LELSNDRLIARYARNAGGGEKIEMYNLKRRIEESEEESKMKEEKIVQLKGDLKSKDMNHLGLIIICFCYYYCRKYYYYCCCYCYRFYCKEDSKHLAVLGRVRGLNTQGMAECEGIVMGDDLGWVISRMPERDDDASDGEMIDTILKFLISLSYNISNHPGYSVDTIQSRSNKIFSRLKETNILQTLFRLFNNYSKEENRIRIWDAICLFHYCQEVESEYLAILKFLKEMINLFIEEKQICRDIVVDILKSLRYVTVILSNIKLLLQMGFESVLFEMIKSDDLTVVQYALMPLANLSLSFSSKECEKLFRGGMFDVFSKLFTRLTFVTSTLPFPHHALERGLLIVRNVVELYEACIDVFLESELVKTVMNMFVTGCSLVVRGPLSEPIRRIVIHICNIFDDCGNSVLNVKKLIVIGCPSILLNSFETLVKERKKGRKELDYILELISRIFQNWSVEGSFSPDATSGGNSSFQNWRR
jgi:hypothetical protein